MEREQSGSRTGEDENWWKDLGEGQGKLLRLAFIIREKNLFTMEKVPTVIEIICLGQLLMNKIHPIFTSPALVYLTFKYNVIHM